MSPGRIVVIGTAVHQTDLLHKLREGLGIGPDPDHTALGFHWGLYRALDEATGEALWPEIHSAAELLALRKADPLMFSREYQNDPRDDAASMFPRRCPTSAAKQQRYDQIACRCPRTKSGRARDSTPRTT
jgi:hypothetical protein